jgi:hypothetical protein
VSEPTPEEAVQATREPTFLLARPEKRLNRRRPSIDSPAA